MRRNDRDDDAKKRPLRKAPFQQKLLDMIKLKISLRAFMIIIPLIGCFAGVEAMRVREQRDAVAALRRAGAQVSYDYEYKNGRFVFGAKPDLPRWILDFGGLDFFYSPVAVVADSVHLSSHIKDSHINQIISLGRLRILILRGDEFSDEGRNRLIGLLAGLNKLERLELNVVGDAGPAHLAGLRGLRVLSLSDTTVGDAGLAHLSGLDRLEELSLDRTSVSDAGLAHLSGLRRLRVLSLKGTRVGDAGLAHLSGLDRLEELDLGHTDVGDAGLAHIANLDRLQSLVLTGTAVGDAGLAHLSGLRRLDVLMAGFTRVNDEGIDNLKKTLPNLRVDK